MRGIIVKSIAGLMIAAGSFFLINAIASPTEAAGCSSNSVIKCGVDTVSEMRSKYNSNYTKGTKDIYTGMGISSDVVNKAKVVDGYIYKNGEVKVNGKTVAKNAKSAGRTKLSGSTKRTTNGTVWYERSTQHSFQTKSTWKVFVFLDSQGRFMSAVMLDCGNPVKAENVVVPPKPVYTCDSLAVKTINRTTRAFTASATTKNGAKVKSYTFDFGDGTKKTTTNKSINHEYSKTGTFTAKVTVNFTVNGKTVSNTGSKCTAKVEVEKPPVKDITVCELETKKIITIKENEFDKSKHSKDLKDCEEPTKIVVCDLESKEIVTINEEDFDESKYSKDVEDCDTPIEVCDLDSKTVVTIDEKDFDDTKHSTDLTDCEETPEVPETPETPSTPETPAELPTTGPAETLLHVIGAVSLVGASAYYLASRRV